MSLLYVNFDPTPTGLKAESIEAGVPGVLAAVPAPVPRPQPGHQPAADWSTSAPEGGTETAPAAAQADALQGRWALRFNLLLLEKGAEQFKNVANYTATFLKQERVDGSICDPQVMELKLRHRPFSVYMRWFVGDKGREVLYVDNENDGKMLVKLGGLKGRLLPVMRLDPNGSMALRESRHAITNVGLLNLARKIITYRRQELEAGVRIRCVMTDDQSFDKRPCYCFVVEYPDQETSNVYRKSVQYIDKELSLPVCIKNYTWPDTADEANADHLDELTLVEHYQYSDIRLNSALSDTDFDVANSDYHFRR